MFLKASGENFLSITGCKHTFYSVSFVNTVGWGKMSMVRQSRSLGILFCMPKIKEPMMKRSTFLFFHWNRKSKIGDSANISSLPLTPETKMSSDSLYPTILNLPHTTLLHILVELLLVRIQILLCCFKSFL